MKKVAILGVLLFIVTVSQAQTKKIAHRSHSGKNETFSILTKGNFGLPVPDSKKTKDKGDSTQSNVSTSDSLKVADSTKKDLTAVTKPKPKRTIKRPAVVAKK